MPGTFRTRALVVDDETAVREICRVVLERAGFAVETAVGVDEARAALAETAFDVVVTDVFLENGHGVELAREIKQRRPSTQIVVMTGRASVSTAVAALKTGACEFLEKPFAPPQLVDAVLASVRKGRDAVVASPHEEVERTKAEVLARVSHELRTPVAVAMLACGLAKSRAGSDEQKLFVQRAEEGVARLRDRVEEIVAFAAAAGRPQLSREDASVLLAEAAACCGLEALKKGVSVVVEAGEPQPLRCDASLVRAALKELIANAVRFGPAGGEVLARAEALDGRVRLSVLDRGPGIPACQRLSVLESFHQSQDTLTRQAPGLGLGLSTARRVADAHFGELEISDRQGGGAAVGLTLPA